MKMSEFDARLNMWELTRDLWAKYIWVSDEYKLLRDKWNYLCEELYPALPRLKSKEAKSPLTFDKLDGQIAKIDGKFRRHFNLRRDEPESLKKFRMGKIRYFSDLEKLVSDISAYVGLLKLAFYQRTVSVEIPYITTGYQHSPERTIGNELMYVVADKVAEAYAKCLDVTKHPSLPRWDGFVTYVPPITESLSLGAFCDIRPYGLVRLSLSERHKSALPPYLLLAHEIGHIPLSSAKTREMRRRFLELAMAIIDGIDADFRFKPEGRNSKCFREQKCDFYHMRAKKLKNFWIGVLVQLFADIFGVKLGGPTVIEALLNETLFSPSGSESSALKFISREILMRGWAAVEYMPKTDTIKKRSDIIEIRIKKTVTQYTKEEGLKRPCFECLEQLGRFIGQKIKEIERSKFDAFIRKGMIFSIDSSEEREIMSNIINGQLCNETDPRKILHCCFLGSQETGVFGKDSDRRVCFASAIHSLAYNTFYDCKGARGK